MRTDAQTLAHLCFAGMGSFVMRRWLTALLVLGACRPSGRPAAGPSVQDATGRPVTLAAPAQRVVSLLPTFTELLFAMGAGDRVVGRTAWCDYPAAARAVPSVGDGMPPNVEAVAARNPDLVILYNSGPNVTAAEQLTRLGIPSLLLDMNRLADLGPATRAIGRLTGSAARAESLALELEALASQLPAHAPAVDAPTVVFVVWDNPPIVIGRGSYLDEIASLGGARNVFHDLTAPSAQVSLETIATRNPDWVAVLADAPGPPAFAARREWRAVRAVRDNRFLILPGSLFGRPGPRSGEAARELRLRLAAEPIR